MKTLVLLRGTHAVGKSTWLLQKNLEHYTVSSDKIRLMLQSPVTNVDGSQGISQSNDKKVWALLYEIVEERMKRGEFTIVDATHSRAQAINSYQEMCKKYRYRCVVVDFSQEASLETILERNRTLDSYKFVPEDVIESIYERLKHDSVPSWAKKIKPSEFDVVEQILVDYTNDYDGFVVFGDLHSCYSPLEQYFEENPFNDRIKYIFVGDYFDRGVEHIEMFNFLMSIKDKKNVLLLTGNHELHLFDYVNGDNVKSADARATIEALEENNVTKNMIKSLTERFAQLAYFKFGNSVYCVTHGGIPTYPNVYTPSMEYVRGVGKYQDSEDVDKAWVANTGENYFSIHGHRNIYNVDIRNTDSTFNLNGTPEYGDYVHCMSVMKKTDTMYYVNTFKLKSTVFDSSRKHGDEQKRSNGNQGIAKFVKETGIKPANKDVADLLSHGGVNVKDLGEIQGTKVFSVNFDRKIFYRKNWCDVNVKARDLFIDADSNVVARSYNKFFNFNEMEETKLHSLTKNLKFPVTAYDKENGFLGILSVYKGEWFIASKSTNKGDFKEYFEALIKPYLNNNLRKFVENYNVSLVFEVIDTVNDPHICEYNMSQVILLDVIYNEFEFSKFSYTELKKFGAKYGFITKTPSAVLMDMKELKSFMDSVESRDDLEKDIEGYVLEDYEGYSFKLKTPYYNFWKKMRKMFEGLKKQGINNETKKWMHSASDFKVWNAIVEHGSVDFNKPLIEIRKELGL
jgi:predicted kinase